MKKGIVFIFIIAVGIGLSSCVTPHHHRVHKKPKPGKVKACDCPDFGDINPTNKGIDWQIIEAK